MGLRCFEYSNLGLQVATSSMIDPTCFISATCFTQVPADQCWQPQAQTCNHQFVPLLLYFSVLNTYFVYPLMLCSVQFTKSLNQELQGHLMRQLFHKFYCPFISVTTVKFRILPTPYCQTIVPVVYYSCSFISQELLTVLFGYENMEESNLLLLLWPPSYQTSFITHILYVHNL